VRGADTVPGSGRGYDAGKKTNGRKRHIAVDTGRLLLAVVVTAASIQDRDGAHRLLTALRSAWLYRSRQRVALGCRHGIGPRSGRSTVIAPCDRIGEYRAPVSNSD
jgi:hypothetical protein